MGMARSELLEVLPSILGSLTTKPKRIADFEDFPVLCTFGKVCLAAVCIDQGILCVCDCDGTKLEGNFSGGVKPYKSTGKRQKRLRDTRGSVAGIPKRRS